MKELFKDVFDYHHHFNQKLIAELKTNFDKLPGRTFPLFCHILNAHQIWNSRIAGGTPYGVQQVHAMEDCPAIDNDNYANTLKILEKDEFDRIVTYKNTRGQEFSNSVRDILFHVANHSTHHKGQIVADFRSKEIAPVVTDYIFFRR